MIAITKPAAYTGRRVTSKQTARETWLQSCGPRAALGPLRPHRPLAASESRSSARCDPHASPGALPRPRPLRCSEIGSRPASWKCILSPGFQDRSRRDPKYVPRARHFCVIEVIILPFQICDRIFQRVTSDSIKCNGSFVRSLYGRICRGGQGGDREIARDRGWLRGVVWSGRVGLLHVRARIHN